MKQIFSTSILCFCIAAIGGTGCTTSNTLKMLEKKDGVTHASAENPPLRMIAIWEPAEGRGVDGMPTRGFAGQVLFIGADSKSLAVDGEVAVYVFDDVGGREEQGRPIHRFDFSKEAWDLHCHQGSLGTTYNVFIPYTRKNWIYQTQCSLLVRFESESEELNSEMVSVSLAGPDVPEQKETLSGTGEPAVDSDLMLDQVESNFRKLQQQPVDGQAERADGRVVRRSERIGTITDRGGRLAISENAPADESFPEDGDSEAALRRKLADLEHRLARLQSDSGSEIQPVNHRVAEVLGVGSDSPLRQAQSSRRSPTDHPLAFSEPYETFPGLGEGGRPAVHSSGRIKLANKNVERSMERRSSEERGVKTLGAAENPFSAGTSTGSPDHPLSNLE